MKLRGLPPRVDAGGTNSFWAAVQKAASRNETDAQTYLESIVAIMFWYCWENEAINNIYTDFLDYYVVFEKIDLLYCYDISLENFTQSTFYLFLTHIDTSMLSLL